MSRKNFFVVEYCGVWKKSNAAIVFVSRRILGLLRLLGAWLCRHGLGSKITHLAISVGSGEQKS